MMVLLEARIGVLECPQRPQQDPLMDYLGLVDQGSGVVDAVLHHHFNRNYIPTFLRVLCCMTEKTRAASSVIQVKSLRLKCVELLSSLLSVGVAGGSSSSSTAAESRTGVVTMAVGH